MTRLSKKETYRRHYVYLKNKYDTDPEFRKRRNDYQARYARERRKRDPEYRARVLKSVTIAVRKYVAKKVKEDPDFYKKRYAIYKYNKKRRQWKKDNDKRRLKKLALK